MRRTLITRLLQLQSKALGFTAFTRCMLALGFLALALGGQLALEPRVADIPAYLGAFAAVLLSSWYCGAGPSILIAALGYPAVAYLLRGHPLFAWEPDDLLFNAGLYLAVSAIIISFVASFRRQHDRLKSTERALAVAEQGLEARDARLRVMQDTLRTTVASVVTAEGKLKAVNTELEKTEGNLKASEAKLEQTRGKLGITEAKLAATETSLEATGAKLEATEGRLEIATATLEDCERRLRASFDHPSLGMAELDEHGRFIAVNERLCRIVGYSREELLGMAVDDITAAEDRLGRDAFGAWLDLDRRCVRRDGSVLWTNVTLSPVRDDAGRFLYSIGIIEDIDERKRAEESLRAAMVNAERAKAGAEAANQAKDRFIAVLSHELRTPLTPVLAAAELMQRKLDEWRRPLEMICRNVQLEARLINDLLDLTRITQDKLTLERKPMDVCAVVERAVEICRPDIGARKLDFALEIGHAPQRVNGDASRLQQVIWNLLSNAVKFTPDGGRIGVRCARENDRVVIEVADTGIGIDPAEAARIFDAFEQGARDTTRQFGGLGLGLAIAKRLIELHEGAISVHSEGKGHGSVFRVSLPLLEAEAEEVTVAAAEAESGPAKRILLVEDNHDTAATMAMLLESFGYQVHTAGGVAQALDAISDNDFDLLISDLGLPDRSGIDLMRELRDSGNALKGIALSGYGQRQDVSRSKEAGFSVHLTKPVDAEGLVETIARLL